MPADAVSARMARSRFTGAPISSVPSAVTRAVSGPMSNAAACSSRATTVRQTPLIARLSPAAAPRRAGSRRRAVRRRHRRGRALAERLNQAGEHIPSSGRRRRTVQAAILQVRRRQPGRPAAARPRGESAGRQTAARRRSYLLPGRRAQGRPAFEEQRRHAHLPSVRSAPAIDPWPATSVAPAAASSSAPRCPRRRAASVRTTDRALRRGWGTRALGGVRSRRSKITRVNGRGR